MPFGLIFGALFFGGLCGLAGLRWIVHPSPAVKVAGLLLALLGGSLAIGLLTRRAWARWAGALAGIVLAAMSLRLIAATGDVLPRALLLASIVAVVLLALPATGDPRRTAVPAPPASRTLGLPGWIAMASFGALIALALWVDPPSVRQTRPGAPALPAAALGRSVSWTDLPTALERARAEATPILATFVTDWCPHCTRMNRRTWRATAVAERVQGLPLVRVDAEEPPGRGGPSGTELAARYGVQGYPVQLLLDADGRVLARYDGYQGPQELLAWLDAALDGRAAAGAIRGRP